MNSKGIVARGEDGLCDKCLKNNASHTYKIDRTRGYGSIYDESTISLDLCDTCNKVEYKKWFEETSRTHGHCKEEYEYEKDIKNLLDSLPLESRQKVWEDDSYTQLPPQMWIDYELNELSHELCKEYGYHSPEERLAYSERFPHCDKVKITVWGDCTKSSGCDHGAHGDETGNCDKHNTCEECFRCVSFTPRNGSALVEVDQMAEMVAHERERLIEMIAYANEMLEVLDSDPENYFRRI